MSGASSERLSPSVATEASKFGSLAGAETVMCMAEWLERERERAGGGGGSEKEEEMIGISRDRAARALASYCCSI